MRRFAQVSAIAVVLVACSGTSTDTSTTGLAAPAADSVPSDWITYADETSGFSISYPNAWEIFALDEAALADLLGMLEDAVPEAGTAALPFQAGLPVSNVGFNPNTSVAVEVLPGDLTVDEYAEAGKRGLKSVFPSYEPTEHVKTVVGSRESVLVHGSYEVSDLDPNAAGRFWMIQLVTTDGRTGWTVTCGQVEADASASEPDLEECEAVVRTFELPNS